jgi:hypothetical protein
MIKKLKNIDFLLEILIAIDAFLSITPYLLWETYKYFTFFDILKKIIEILICIVFLFRKKIHVEKYGIGICLSFVCVYLYYHLDSYTFSIGLGTIMQLIIISIFLVLPNSNKKNIFKYFLKIFSYSLLMGILFSILNIIGLNIKSDFIEPISSIKVNTYQHYRHYFGCVFREKINYSPKFKLLCGMFDEPGSVGTISALLLCAIKFDIKKYKETIILIIAGIMSMSTAFFVMAFIAIMYYLIKSKNIKKIFIGILIIMTIFLLIFIFRNNSIVNQYIINKFFGKYTLLHNNRTSKEFDIIFKDFLEGNKIFFGCGNGNPIFDTVDAASYKVLIFNIGFVGFFILIGWFVFWGIKQSNKNYNCLFLLFIFLLSIYQRPWVLYLYYIVILFGGFEIIKDEKKKQINKKDL